MLGGMQDEAEYDNLFWALYGVMPIRRRVRRLRALRQQVRLDLTDAEARLTALRHQLVVLDNAIGDYMVGDKQRRQTNA